MAITTSPSGVRIELRVMPRAPRTIVDGIRGGRLVVRVTAPPVDGAANDAVIVALAGALDLPKRAIRIVAGETSRNKTAEITGLDAHQVGACLGVSSDF